MYNYVPCSIHCSCQKKAQKMKISLKNIIDSDFYDCHTVRSALGYLGVEKKQKSGFGFKIVLNQTGPPNLCC